MPSIAELLLINERVIQYTYATNHFASLFPSKNSSKSPLMCFAHIKSNLPHDQNQRDINSYNY